MTKAAGHVEEIDAITLLKDDHAKVETLFAAFRKTRSKCSPKEKAAQVEEVCRELAVHAALEEELFYPALSQVIGDDELIGEAQVEHGEAKHLIGELIGMDPQDPLYDPMVQVLGEYVHHHVEEEQNKMFPKARKAKVDLVALGEKLLERKEGLLHTAEAKGVMALIIPPKPATRKHAR